MAAARIPPPNCGGRSTWSSDHRIADCTVVVRGGEAVRWGCDSGRLRRSMTSSSKRQFRPCKRAARWRRAGFDFGGSSSSTSSSSAEQAKEEEDASTLVEMTTLVDGLFKLNEAVKFEASKGIDADVRSRVDVLYNRATLLKYSADSMVAAGDRVPVQLTATLKGLQREHASVENIIRLVMESGPVITGIINDVEEKEVSDVVVKEKGESQALLFESLIRQSSVQALSGTEEVYAMGTPAADDSDSPFAAFRREIERRVMQQLALEKKKGLGKLGDHATPEFSNNVCEPVELNDLAKLRNDLSALEHQLANAKDGSARADRAEAQLQQLTTEMAATLVPLDVHEQVVKLERQSLRMARKKIAQVTAELREKEVILGAVKQEMKAEQNRLLKQVRMLSGELSERGDSSVEEVEAAVKTAVHELEMELRKALQRAESMKLELGSNETLLKQLQTEWDVERTSFHGELANVKEQLAELQQEQAADRTRFVKAVEKVNELEDSVTRLQQSMVEAEEERINKGKFELATIKSLVVDMLKRKHVRAKRIISTVDSSLLEAVSDHTDSDEAKYQVSSAEGELELLMLSEDSKAVTALETFFHMMGALEGANHRLRNSAHDLKPGLRKLGSFKGDVNRFKPIITLYYESSWEFAYLHYSADSSGWTELPGVCMRNDIVVNEMPQFKVIDIEGSSIEFVLTDGRGSWDCAPIGGNYHIKNSGTFLLSSGFIKQKQ